MKIQELYRKTDATRKMMGKYVRFVALKTGYNKQRQGFVAAKTQSTARVTSDGSIVQIPTAQRSTYTTVITFLDMSLNVNCSCSCPDFMYREEVALNHHGAADIFYSNGEHPKFTNPTLQPYMCKHLCALYVKIQPQLSAVKTKKAK